MTLERWQAWLIAASILCAGLAVGVGAFVGGYAFGEQSAPPPPTALAEKTYTAADLEAALTACKLEGVTVEASSATLVGGDHSPMRRACFVDEMGAPPIAQHEYGWSNWGTSEEYYLEGGEYSWSNVSMTWEQTDQGRDVTITVAG